ncbi:MAG TPA: hypothetical protein VHC69_26130 [Polyangiaceae bacterium]|nr:hypothetical protein [Polyangiaceae bacterium]
MPAHATPLEVPLATDLAVNSVASPALASHNVEGAPVSHKEGSLDEVLRGAAAWCIVHGDVLHVLRDLPDGCAHAFVTDPPYSNGGAFRGDRVKEAPTETSSATCTRFAFGRAR